jgi:hypothetical protein
MVKQALLACGLLVGCACQAWGSTSGCDNVQIDWVDFIQVGSTEYVAGLTSATGVEESELGDVVAHVKFKLDGNVCDPSYRRKDGDAAFLEPGTAIYAVVGRPASQVLAAHRDGRLIEYDASSPASS